MAPTLEAMRPLLPAMLLALFASSLTSAQETRDAVVLSGKYSDLHPEQRRLVDDWFRRFSEVVKKEVSPEDGYNNVPISSKTTFSAITHALLRTTLTDESGKSLDDSAMVLIERIDHLFGTVPGERGDKQFRIYVSLRPNALDILERSKEFERTADNTVYHKGFPICFRGGGGTPSIQVSISKDGKRADIDVDYRSSKFPVALFNGHLSSSNSDIRAGNNDERHNNRWAGVSNWWRSLLGLPLAAIQPLRVEEVLHGEPRTKPNAKPATAIHDFFQALLVDRKPEGAIGYFSDTALPCMEIEQGKPTDRGVARFSMLMGLRQVNDALGPIKDLSEVLVGVRISRPRLRVIEQPYHSQFVLYDVREDLAEEFDCANRLDPSLISAKARRSTSFGKYVGAIFYIKTPQGNRGETVATLWSKQNKYWRLVSYATEPEPDAARSASVATTSLDVPALASDPGNPELIRASRDFFQKWFVRRRVNEAFQYMSPRAYSCANLYRDADTPEAKTPADTEKEIRAGMQQALDFAGAVGRLEDAIKAPEVSHPDVRLVKHADSKSFVIVSIPESMGVEIDCSRVKPVEQRRPPPPDSIKAYGQYYATGFHMSKAVEEPPVLWLVWTRENDQWKIVAYHVLTP